MVEFKHDLDSGKWFLIEINGRFWGSLPLAVFCGINFPRFLVVMLLEDRALFPGVYPTDRFARNLLPDLAWWKARLQHDSYSPRTCLAFPVDLGCGLLRGIRGREICDTFAIDDQRPGWLEISDRFFSIYLKVVEKLKTRFAKLPVVRRIKMTDAKRKLHRAESILVVCKGNICRSPFAAALLRERLPAKRVVSAGTYPEPGRSSPPHAVKAARELVAVDLTGHRSMVLRQRHIDAADVVVIFDDQNARVLRESFLVPRSKMVSITALNPSAPAVISDPWRQEIEGFISCYRAIQNCVASL
jgi:protein-tyrosine-phosphatase